jgi:hypothetical protein
VAAAWRKKRRVAARALIRARLGFQGEPRSSSASVSASGHAAWIKRVGMDVGGARGSSPP